MSDAGRWRIDEDGGVLLRGDEPATWAEMLRMLDAHDRLVAAARAMVAAGPAHKGGAYCDNDDCMYCDAALGEREPHAADCAYVAAVAALAEIDGAGRET